jgi:PAS domain S-box-containing protein
MGDSLPPNGLRNRGDGGGAGDARRRFEEASLSLSTLLTLVAIVIPLISAAGWIFGLQALTQGLPSWPAMQPNTAIGLILAAAAVLLSRSNWPPLVRRLAICSMAAIILLLGTATLCEYIFLWDLGIDRLFVHELPTPAHPYPGRPSPQTSLNFALLGASLLLLQVPRAPITLAQIGALLALASALVALTGYIFGVGALYRFPVSAALTGMSAPTAVTFICLSLALLCSRPSEGMMTIATSDSSSGAIARRILLILIVGWPLVGGLTLLGVNAGWYALDVQASLFALIMLGLLLWNTWEAARHGYQSELARRAANEATKKARDEFEALATRVHNLVEQGSDAVFVADLDGRYTDVNGAACRMLGYSREEIIGKTILDLILPEDIPRFIRHKERLLGGDVEISEWIIRRKDGTRFPAEVSAKILPDGQWQAFVRDITERKRMESALRLSEAKFSGLVSISADAIVMVDREQNIVTFNAGAEKVFGYSRGEAMHKPLETLIPERFRVSHRQHVARFAAGPDLSRPMEARGPVFGLRKNGEEFPADAAISKLTVEGESILAVSVRDVTEQKRVENEQRFLSEAGAALSSTFGYEDTLQCIASLAVRGIADLCIVDRAGDDGALSRRKIACRDPLRRQSCEALARAPFDPSYLAPSVLRARKPGMERDLTPERLMSLAAGDAAVEAWRAFDPKSMIAFPLAAQGKVVAMVALLSHRAFKATDLGLAEEFAYRATTAVERALLDRELREAVKAREDVLAIVSHDLGNPLTGILMAAKQLRLADLAKADKLKEYTGAIEICAGQMKQLIKDLLDFSKIQSGTFSVRKAAEHAIEVIAPAVESAKMQAEARGQALTLDVPATLPEILCDKHRIVQALSNLLGNAVKFTPEGGAIRVEARVQDNEFVMSVADTGPGIPPEYLPRIFDRYWQADESVGAGAGLGLAIAKGITEAHGGRIWAESQMGVGSVFSIALPLDRTDERSTRRRLAKTPLSSAQLQHVRQGARPAKTG